MTNWIQQKPVYEIREECIATIVRGGIRLNAIFGKAIGENKGAQIFIDTTGRKVGIKFIQESTPETFTVGSDGGGRARATNSKMIGCGSVIKGNPILAEMAAGPKEKARLKFIHVDNMWETTLIPIFHLNVEETPPRDGDIGVYRYMFDNQIVYIGQGNIKQRLASEDRRSWIFDKIEYFLAKDSAEAVLLESLYIEDYKKEFKRLPMFNKVSGINS